MRIGWKTSVTAVSALALGVAGSAVYAKTAKPDYVLVPTGEAKFAPLDPKMPGGLQMALLSGDLKTGPVAFYLKLPKGPTGIHWHTSDYYAYTIEGTTKHWLAGTNAADAKPNPPGTFWFQPGGAAATAHGDECVSESCTLLIQMPSKFDFMPGGAAKK
jgi:hypothetical protein